MEEQRIIVQFETAEWLAELYLTGVDSKEIYVDQGVIFFGKQAAISLDSFVSYRVEEKQQV